MNVWADIAARWEVRVSEILKQHYLPAIREQLNNEVMLLKLLGGDQPLSSGDKLTITYTVTIT